MLFPLLLTIGIVLACKTDEDCSLNGICSKYAGQCKCDPGWRGNDCGELDILPARTDTGYNRTAEKISSWCFSVVQDPHEKDLHHAFLSEFSNHCGLDYWAPYSRVIRAESKTGPAGPYTFAEEVVGHFAHNPTVVYSPADRLYLLYYIGCPQKVEDKCTDPSFTCGPGNFHNGESGISVLSSPDLQKWNHHGQVIQGENSKKWNAVVTNPSPLPLCSDHRGAWQQKRDGCNSDMLLVYRGCPLNCSDGPETERM